MPIGWAREIRTTSGRELLLKARVQKASAEFPKARGKDRKDKPRLPVTVGKSGPYLSKEILKSGVNHSAFMLLLDYLSFDIS